MDEEYTYSSDLFEDLVVRQSSKPSPIFGKRLRQDTDSDSDSDATQPPEIQNVEEINVNHVHCQTDISSLIHVDKPIFNKCFQDELSLVSTCHSFILENTLADDLTPIYIETDSQTFESGGFVTQSQTQTEFGLENLNEIIVEEKSKNSILTEKLDILEKSNDTVSKNLAESANKLVICNKKLKRTAGRENYHLNKVKKLEKKVNTGRFQGDCCEESKLRIACLENQLGEKDQEMKDLQESNQYLQDLLNDNEDEKEMIIFMKKVRNTYQSLSSVYLSFPKNGVSAVIKAVLKMVNIKTNKLPCRTSVLDMNIQRLYLAQAQIVDIFVNDQNTVLLTDETSKFGSKFMGYEACDSEGNFWVLGLRDIETKSANDTIKVFKQILNDIDEELELGIFNNEVPCSDKSYKDNDPGTCRLVRTASKAFGEGSGGDEKSGCQGKFKTFAAEFLREHGMKTVPLRSFRDNKVHSWLESFRPLSMFVTCPLWSVLENGNVSIIDMNEKYLQLVTFLDDASQNVAAFMSGDLLMFGKNTQLEKGPIYNSLIGRNTFDSTVEMFLQVLLSALCKHSRKLCADHLPEGN
ncbi:unnamed protein product [Mytilus edulis]|uniref:Uncharacterized protein n=1 Tax=Mytilus edulis TaxID=6550 RepID=A0A8S3UG51_MYTED|nr:unnamed protein product [Mytilus edulis]